MRCNHLILKLAFTSQILIGESVYQSFKKKGMKEKREEGRSPKYKVSLCLLFPNDFNWNYILNGNVSK